jgi:Leucine-rich repeat (LRR) protein
MPTADITMASQTHAQRQAHGSAPPSYSAQLDMPLILRILAEANTPLDEQLCLSRAVHDAILLTGSPSTADGDPSTSNMVSAGRSSSTSTSDSGASKATNRKLVLTIDVAASALIALGQRRLAWLDAKHQERAGTLLMSRAGAATAPAAGGPPQRALRVTSTMQVNGVRGHPPARNPREAQRVEDLLQTPRPSITSLIVDTRSQPIAALRHLSRWQSLRELHLMCDNCARTLDLGCVAALPALTDLSVRAWTELGSLKSLPRSLTKLCASGNPRLQAMDITGLSRLVVLQCAFNRLTALHGLQQATCLTSLDLDSNSFTSLKLDRLQRLRIARLQENELMFGRQPRHLSMPAGARLDELTLTCDKGGTLPAGVAGLGGVRQLSLGEVFGPLTRDLNSFRLQGLERLGVRELEMGCFATNTPSNRTWVVWGAEHLPCLDTLRLKTWYGVTAIDCSRATGLTRLELDDLGNLKELRGAGPGLQRVALQDLRSLRLADLRGAAPHCSWQGGLRVTVGGCPGLKTSQLLLPPGSIREDKAGDDGPSFVYGLAGGDRFVRSGTGLGDEEEEEEGHHHHHDGFPPGFPPGMGGGGMEMNSEVLMRALASMMQMRMPF